LGVLDKATLRLGDGSAVNFENSLIFLTSNLGAREMMKEINPDFGFQSVVPADSTELHKKIENVGVAAIRRKFAPEFMNRIDAVITYQPLDSDALAAIIDRQIAELQRHVNTRLRERCFSIDVPRETRMFLLRKGTSKEYGARELKRTVHRHVTQPLATLVASGRIQPGTSIRIEPAGDGESLVIRLPEGTVQRAREHPVVLLVDDNRDLLRLFKLQLSQGAWTVLTAESGREAQEAIAKQMPDAIVLDYLLPDANGVELAATFRSSAPEVEIVIATGADVAAEDEARCERHALPILRKPFLAEDLASLIRSRLGRRSGASAQASL
jgi:CheY-like chemotaxis protein